MILNFILTNLKETVYTIMTCVYGSELDQLTDEYGIRLRFHKEREIFSLVVKVLI
jgi:Na+/melibiose symporter-like transporter